MENKLEVNQWYVDLVDDCKTIITEAIFTSRWALVEGYWNLGKRIREDLNFQEYAKGNKSCVQGLALSLKQSERTLYYAVQCFDTYPDIQKLPEGKNITWNKLITKYLPAENKITLPLPEGKYNVIYADPPWPYPERQDPKNLYGNVKYHYETMRIKDLCTMSVKNIITENSVLFLWVATNFLEESFEVIKSWGFDYKSQMVWVKEGQGGIGWYFWGDHEILLIATKGSMLPKDKFSSVLKAPRREHSQKPNEVYEIIEKMYPNCKYLELFARQKYSEKWDVWGKEVNGN